MYLFALFLQLFNVVKLTMEVNIQLSKINYLMHKFYKHGRRAKLVQLTFLKDFAYLVANYVLQNCGKISGENG